jgi:hypothetical protein
MFIVLALCLDVVLLLGIEILPCEISVSVSVLDSSQALPRRPLLLMKLAGRTTYGEMRLAYVNG